MDIAGKVFIVTGGASGLGEGTARMLAQAKPLGIGMGQQVRTRHMLHHQVGCAGLAQAHVVEPGDVAMLEARQDAALGDESLLELLRPPPTCQQLDGDALVEQARLQWVAQALTAARADLVVERYSGDPSRISPTWVDRAKQDPLLLGATAVLTILTVFLTLLKDIAGFLAGRPKAD